MIFRAELCDLVLEGRKTATRRLKSDKPKSPWWRERCRYKVGQRFAVQPGRSAFGEGLATVRAVYPQRLGDVTDDQAYEEGFADLAEFEEAFRKINGALNVDQVVWVVEFGGVVPFLEEIIDR
jgi:hypothetical protein